MGANFKRTAFSPWRSKCFSFKVDPIFEGLFRKEEQTGNYKKLFAFVKVVGKHGSVSIYIPCLVTRQSGHMGQLNIEV